MAIGLWIGLFSLVLSLQTRLLAVIPSRPLRVADIVLTNLCLAAIAAEGSLRVVSNLAPSPILARNRDTPQDLLVRNRFAPGTIRFGVPTNSMGHYDREFTLPPREGKLIVSIGDSFSASSVPLPYHFTKVAEDRLLDSAVYNFGAPGIGPPEYHHLLVHEALPLEPDLLLVNIFVGNDVTEARALNWPLVRSWFDRENVLICTVPHRVVTVLGEDLPTIAPRLIESEEELHRELPWIRDPMMDRPGFSEEAFMRIEVGRATQVFAPEDFYAELFHWLSEMREAAGETPVMVMLIPDEYQAEEDLWEKVSARLPAREPDRFRHQRVIGAWLESQGIPYLDILPHIRSVKPLADGRRHVYRLRNTHLNVQGNEIAGVALAEFVTENFGFQKKPAVKDR